MDIHSITVKYEGIGFTALAVVRYSLEDWIKWASERYFGNVTPSDREAKLTEVYNLCLKAKQDAQPKHEPAEDTPPVVEKEALPKTGRGRRATARNSTGGEEEAANNS
jgi:hypothetical protein